MATPNVPVWSRDYYYGRDPETNPGTPLPPPNTTPWLKQSVVNDNNTQARNDYISGVYGNVPRSYLGTVAGNRSLAGTPELGNIAMRQPGSDYDAPGVQAGRYGMNDPYITSGMPYQTAPDPSLIGNTGSVMNPIAPEAQIPAGMMVNPFWNLPGQEPYITKEAYDALYAPGGVMNSPSVGPAGDAYDAVLQTRGNPADLGYDPAAPWQRENDYYAALKMRNDISNATSAGYVTRQNPDGTFNVSGLTTPNAQGQWMPDARANVNDQNIRSTYNVGSPPTKAMQAGQDPLQFLMSQEINPSQARIMGGYSGKGATPVYAPFGATAMQWPGVDVPLGGQTYEEAIAKGATDPTLAHLYANNAPPSVVPGGTGAAGLAASAPRLGTPGTGADWISSVPVGNPSPVGSDRDVELKAIMRDLNALDDAERRALYVAGDSRYKELRKDGYILYEDGSVEPPVPSSPQTAPPVPPSGTANQGPILQAAMEDPNSPMNADGWYNGISLTDWAATLDTMQPEERAKFLAEHGLLATKLVRGYRTGGWTMPGAPFMVGESGPEIVQPTGGGQNFVMPMLNRTGGGRRTSSNTGNPGGSGPITTQPISPTPLQDTRPWWERDVPNPRGAPPPPAPAPGSEGDMSNPWNGKNVMLPQNFWGLSPLEQQAILNGMAGDKYNPDYIRGLAEKYRLGGVGGWNNTQGY